VTQTRSRRHRLKPGRRHCRPKKPIPACLHQPQLDLSLGGARRWGPYGGSWRSLHARACPSTTAKERASPFILCYPMPPSRATARATQAPPLLPRIRGLSFKAWRRSERRWRVRGRVSVRGPRLGKPLTSASVFSPRRSAAAGHALAPLLCWIRPQRCNTPSVTVATTVYLQWHL
jgi:hypothetical protein